MEHALRLKRWIFDKFKEHLILITLEIRLYKIKFDRTYNTWVFVVKLFDSDTGYVFYTAKLVNNTRTTCLFLFVGVSVHIIFEIHSGSTEQGLNINALMVFGMR